MDKKQELPELPAGFQWGVVPTGEAIQFGLQSDGQYQNGVRITPKGSLFWVEYTFITVEPEDSDEEIWRVIKLNAAPMYGRLYEQLKEARDRREKQRIEDALRHKRIAKVKDFLERNWNGF